MDTINMNGFKNIQIDNFRGIDHLKIDDFSRVNVFLGQNGSGKSMVLEAIIFALAIFALATTTNKQVFVTTHSKEILSRLSQMPEESPAYQQELCLYTLEKKSLKDSKHTNTHTNVYREHVKTIWI